jgi:hypothetical protein
MEAFNETGAARKDHKAEAIAVEPADNVGHVVLPAEEEILVSLMLLCLSRADGLFWRTHFSGEGCFVLTGYCWGGQDREGPLLAEGRLLLGHVRRVRKIRPGTAGGSFEGQQVRGSRILGQAVPGV